MKALVLAVLLSPLFLGARCDHVAGTPDPCGDYMYTCHAALGGGCCPDGDECMAWGTDLKCVYRGNHEFGAGPDGGARAATPRVFP